MQEVELQEMFGRLVLVQFREPLFLVDAGESAVGAVLRADGNPDFVGTPQGFAPRAVQYVQPKVRKRGETGDPDATYYVLARIAPAAGGRVSVCYELGRDHVAYVMVRPSDIVAVTGIQQLKREEKQLIEPAS